MRSSWEINMFYGDFMGDTTRNPKSTSLWWFYISWYWYITSMNPYGIIGVCLKMVHTGISKKKTFNGDKPWDFRVTYFRQTHLNFVSTRGCWWALAPILGTLWWINVLDSQFVGPLCQLLSKHVQKPTGAVRNLVGARCHIHAVASLYPFTSGWYI